MRMVSCTVWKVSIFGVFQVRILPHSDYIQTRKNPNTNTFNAVLKDACVGQKFVFIGSNFVIPNVSILMFPLTIVLTFITQKLNFHRKKGKWDIFLFSLSYFIFRLYQSTTSSLIYICPKMRMSRELKISSLSSNHTIPIIFNSTSKWTNP